MPAIKFRIPNYDPTNGISHSNLGDYLLGFASTGINFKIRVGSYPDFTNTVNPRSYKRHGSVSNIIPFGSESGSVSNDYLNTNLSLLKIPNWSSTLNINFGDAAHPSTYDVTTAYITASGIDGGLSDEFGEFNTRPSSIRIYAAEICHPLTSTGIVGSGSTTWSSVIYLTDTAINLTRNPGPSGVTGRVGSTGIPSNTHDWYLALTISPLDINSIPIMPFSCIVEYV